MYGKVLTGFVLSASAVLAEDGYGYGYGSKDSMVNNFLSNPNLMNYILIAAVVIIILIIIWIFLKRGREDYYF